MEWDSGVFLIIYEVLSGPSGYSNLFHASFSAPDYTTTSGTNS